MGGRNRFLRPATAAKWTETEKGGERLDSSDNVPYASSWRSSIDLTSRELRMITIEETAAGVDGRSRECARRRLIYRVAFSACSRQQWHVLPPLSTNQGHTHAWARIFRRVCVSALELIVLWYLPISIRWFSSYANSVSFKEITLFLFLLGPENSVDITELAWFLLSLNNCNFALTKEIEKKMCEL